MYRLFFRDEWYTTGGFWHCELSTIVSQHCEGQVEGTPHIQINSRVGSKEKSSKSQGLPRCSPPSRVPGRSESAGGGSGDMAKDGGMNIQNYITKLLVTSSLW